MGKLNEMLPNLANEIIIRRAKIKLLRDAIKIEDGELKGVEDKFKNELKKKELRSIPYNNYYLGVSNRKYVSIRDPKLLITQLKRKGLKDCIIEAVDRKKFDVYAKKALKSGEKFNGTEISESEYVVVKPKKERKEKK